MWAAFMLRMPMTLRITKVWFFEMWMPNYCEMRTIFRASFSMMRGSVRFDAKT
jgi:hypothetical protein